MWVSGGSNTQNKEGTQLDLSWFRLLSPTSSSIVIFMLRMPNLRVTNGGKSREIGRGPLGAILELFDVLPRTLGTGPIRISLSLGAMPTLIS